MSMYTYKAAALSDVGTTKPINQDSYYLKMGGFDREYFLFALIADGMGGVSEGEIASRSISAAFANWFHEDLPCLLEDNKDGRCPLEDSLFKSWQQVVDNVNLEINNYSHTQGMEEGEGPGSTLTCIFLFGGQFYAANIGDSRIYMMSSSFRQITTDHSWAQEQIDLGESEEKINADARSNSLTRCIGCGIAQTPKADFFLGEYEPGDMFLLCSDGLRRVILPEKFEEVLLDASTNTREKCLISVDGAKEAGETDNITAIIIETAQEKEIVDRSDMERRFSMAESTYIESKGNVTEELLTR